MMTPGLIEAIHEERLREAAAFRRKEEALAHRRELSRTRGIVSSAAIRVFGGKRSASTPAAVDLASSRSSSQ